MLDYVRPMQQSELDDAGAFMTVSWTMLLPIQASWTSAAIASELDNAATHPGELDFGRHCKRVGQNILANTLTT